MTIHGRAGAGLLVALLGLGTGCGGGTGTAASNLDCAWLAGNNCVKTTAAPAAACLPPSTESGVLSADNKTCTYSSGAVVTFETPLVLPIPNDFPWKLNITSGGQPCLHYEELANNGFKLTVGGKTVTNTVAFTQVTYSCPDGTSYGSPNPTALLGCPAGLNIKGWSSTDNSVSLGMNGLLADNEATLQFFSCSRP